MSENNKNEKIVSSANYVAKDVDYEKAKADLQVPTSGSVDITTLISEGKCCGGGCKGS